LQTRAALVVVVGGGGGGGGGSAVCVVTGNETLFISNITSRAENRLDNDDEQRAALRLMMRFCTRDSDATAPGSCGGAPRRPLFASSSGVVRRRRRIMHVVRPGPVRPAAARKR
jgi:hypothetical protein